MAGCGKVNCKQCGTPTKACKLVNGMCPTCYSASQVKQN